MSMELADSVAVITGAGSGIGRATALSLARRGARLVVTDIDADRAATVKDEIGGAAVSAKCDVTTTSELEAVRDLTIDRFGRVDIVMNNVGVPVFGAVEDIPLEGWQRIIDINLLGIVRSNLVFLPILIEQGSGHIINTASIAGLLPYGYDRIPYTATKHAVVGMSKSLAVYLRAKGVGVSCLCPAAVKTNIAEQLTVYGNPVGTPVAPKYAAVEADLVGEQVADAVETGRFLVLTAAEVADDLRQQGEDMDGYLESVIKEYT